ncbi:MAG: sugar phosphate isomerase/epimerase [Chloroflexota bacterium]|nr:sugar phosphate isomerase/epimerase [Chloroflexota bacterium]
MAGYPPLGAQLIVFSRQVDVEEHIESVLEAVREAGFGAVEIGTGLCADEPERLQAALAANGLAVAGMHGGLDQDLDRTLALMDSYGTRDLCISGMGGWECVEAESYRRDIEAFNEMGSVCARHGAFLHYHNHAYEFAPTDEGVSGMDLILAEMDADVADLCVDVAWVQIGGRDPAGFLLDHKEQIGYLHLKDYEGDRHWVELGAGVVSLVDVMEALEVLDGVRWVVYEQDTSDRGAAESCAMSHRYLVDTFGYS